jgi:hypothetical protein
MPTCWSRKKADALVTLQDTLYYFGFKLRGKQLAGKKSEQEAEGDKETKEAIPAPPGEVEAAVKEALYFVIESGTQILPDLRIFNHAAAQTRRKRRKYSSLRLCVRTIEKIRK